MGAAAIPILVSVAGSLAGSLLQKAMAPDTPAPGAPAAAPRTDEGEAQRQQASAAAQQRRRAAAAQGRSSTIATGPKGLGALPDQNKQTTTVLGY